MFCRKKDHGISFASFSFEPELTQMVVMTKSASQVGGFQSSTRKGELMKPILQMCKLGHREAKSLDVLKWQDECCLLIAPSERWGFAFPACLFYSSCYLSRQSLSTFFLSHHRFTCQQNSCTEAPVVCPRS